MRALASALLLTIAHFVAGQVRINEICAANGDLVFDPNFTDFPAFVELYNAGSTSVNLTGYTLSDKPDSPGKWTFPTGTTIAAKGYLMIWCDDRNTGLHTNFDLDPDGESVVLTNASGTQVDRIDFPLQYVNVTYGRLSDGGGTINYMVSPTPGASNLGPTGVNVLQAPQFSLEPGRYSSAQTLSIVPASTDDEIRYTIDGSEPTAASPKYTAPVQLTKTTTVKTKVYRTGYLPSETDIRTFFINERSFSLPVISISTTPAYFFDNTIGIMVDGTNGVSGPCMNQPKNWHRDWDRHGVVELYSRSGEKLFGQHVDIRIQGGCSRNNPQKSLVLRARDKFGGKTMEYEFFKTKEINDYGAVVLRNGGNDFYYAMFRDGLMQSIPIGQMDIDYLAFEPSVVFINGNYWGIQNIREKVDGDYIEANFGVDSDDVDIMETWGAVIEGTSARWNMYIDSLQRIQRNSPEAFAFMNRYIDVQNFVNYLVAEIYYANTDWPGNNVKYWRQRSTNGKFRWIFWDLDFGMGLYNDRSYPTHPTLEFVTDPDNTEWPNPSYSTRPIRLALEIPQFRERFIQTLTTSLGTTFKAERVIGMIDEFQNNIKDEFPYHAQRWGLNAGTWNSEVERMRNFARQRNDYLLRHVAEFFDLGDNVRLNVATFPAGAGAVELNGITNPSVNNALYFENLPFRAAAVSEPGYKFSHFKVRKVAATNEQFLGKAETWRYHDGGILPAADWMNSEYNDATWKEGPAELGYGDSDEATVVSYGPTYANKYPTTYFRKAFTVADTVGLSELFGSVLFDDGVIVYLNGKEVYRQNMPAEPVTYSTYASANQMSENAFFPFTIPKGAILPGRNVIAAEVHQLSATSSDLSFNFALSAIRSGEATEVTINSPMIEDIANSDVTIEAYFVPATRVSGLVINEFTAENSTLEDEYGETNDWIEIYNAGSAAIELGDLFVTDQLSSKMKHRIRRSKDGSTIIEPGAYKLLWADDDVEQGPLHLGFKLSADGEEIGIFQKIGAVAEKIDEVVFEKQILGTTFSRIPNITGDFTLTSIATPLAPNQFDVPTSVEDESYDGVRMFPNPVSDLLKIESPDGRPMRIELIGTSGKVIRSVENFQSGDELSLSGEGSGLYLVRIKTGKKTVARKIIKR